MTSGVKGRTILTEEEREIIANIRKAEALRWAALEKRDELIVEAMSRGIHHRMIGAAAGFRLEGQHGCPQVYKILKRPFKVGMRTKGKNKNPKTKTGNGSKSS